MAHDVFISYSSKDKLAADAVCAALERERVRCWIAPRDVAPGTDWPGSIMEGIAGSKILVLVFSARADASRHVRRELLHACGQELTVIPFRVERSSPTGGMAYFLGEIHWLDAMTPPMERHHALLVARIKSVLTQRDDVPEQVAFTSSDSEASRPGPPFSTSSGKHPAPQSSSITSESRLIQARAWIETARDEAESMSEANKAFALGAIAAAQAQAGDKAGCRRTVALALLTAQTMRDESRKSSAQTLRESFALSAIAAAQAQAGDIASALLTVQSVKDDDDRTSALRDIAAAQARVGDRDGSRRTFEAALLTARAIRTGDDKASSLRAIAAAQAQAGDIAAARLTTQLIKHDSLRASALRAIAAAQAQAGDVAAALLTVGTINKDPLRASALRAVAAAQAHAGDVVSALPTAQAIKDDDDKAAAFGDIAAARAQAGDRAGSRETFAAALRLTETVEDDFLKASALCAIAAAQARAGEKASSRQTFGAALLASHFIPDKADEISTLNAIAAAQARAGEFAAVIATLTLLPAGENRSLGYIAAAEALLKTSPEPHGTPTHETNIATGNAAPPALGTTRPGVVAT